MVSYPFTLCRTVVSLKPMLPLPLPPCSVLTPLQVAKACLGSYPYLPDPVALMHEFQSNACKARQAQRALAGVAAPGATATCGGSSGGVGISQLAGSSTELGPGLGMAAHAVVGLEQQLLQQQQLQGFMQCLAVPGRMG